MRILAITPIVVDAEELGRRQARYDQLSPAGIRVELENLGTGGSLPRALESAEDIAASEAALLERFGAADSTAYDAYLPDCVLDPVVDHADQLARPVHGIGRLAAHYLAGLGATTGAVARNRAIADELDRRLTGYGLDPRPTAVLDLSVTDIADDAAWTAAVERTIETLDCDVVLNACSAVALTRPAGGSPVPDRGAERPAVLDPTAAALRALAMFAEVSR
ncbi:aspartate/glutamate racemase family protein [Nocardioides sp. SYSU DS0663]|uniref:aspartate/glutamate racemase family protein n=1 Tax=Nocardioides sp. SYSU DS0663 TaxID=3416445 RepID=UPI003F4B8407